MDYNALALELHGKHRGKIEIKGKVPVKDRDDLSTAYTPGVAEPCRRIAAEPDAAWEYTTKGNMVAVVTDGTAVLGLGDIGPLAALPVMEGKALLFKEFAEDGVDVSGGEAQKIAIARALYKNAPFIILDEPTAALDPIAEAEIYAKFNDIAGDKTAVYISHRLSSCKFCDEIAVFDHGQVIQQGTHDSLLADEGGKYYALWMAQAQYYTE